MPDTIQLTILARKTLDKDRLPFGKQNYYLEDMIAASQDLAVEIVTFVPNEWDRVSEEAWGYIFQAGQWKRVKRRFSKLVYDRYWCKNEEEEGIIKHLHAFLDERGARILNPTSLRRLLRHKVNFHKFLETETSFPGLAYATELNASELKRLLSYHSTVFIKPITSSRGRYISIITQQTDGFHIRSWDFPAAHLPTAEAAIQYVKTHQPHRPTGYFMQEGAKLALLNGSPVDIRIVMQNKGEYAYQITGKGMRIGSKGNWLANINAGGSAIALEEISGYLSAEYQQTVTQLHHQLDQLCLACSKALHNKLGSFLEIGFDILLTQDKGPIILEANSNFARWIFNVIAHNYPQDSPQWHHFKDLRRQSVLNPALYAIAIA